MNAFSYHTSKSVKRFTWRRFISAAILVTLFIVEQIYDIGFIKPSTFYILIAYYVATIYYELNELHTYQIYFDETEGQVRLFARTYFGKPKVRELPMPDIHLSVLSRKRKGRRKIYLIEFVDKRGNVVPICQDAHGFSSVDLYHIYKTAESSGIETKVA